MASRVVRAPVEFPREFRNRFANEQLDLHARSYLSCRRSPVHSSVPRFFRISRGVLLRRNVPSSERVRKKERGRRGGGEKERKRGELRINVYKYTVDGKGAIRKTNSCNVGEERPRACTRCRVFKGKTTIAARTPIISY